MNPFAEYRVMLSDKLYRGKISPEKYRRLLVKLKVWEKRAKINEHMR
jgi:hypothetical protein